MIAKIGFLATIAAILAAPLTLKAESPEMINTNPGLDNLIGTGDNLVNGNIWGWVGNSAWGVTTLAVNINDNVKPSLSIDTKGQMHLIYVDSQNDLKYASGNGTSWSTETVDDQGNIAGSPSLTPDSSDKPHVSYFESNNEDLFYAYKNPSGNWVKQTVDSAGRVGLHSSIKVAKSGTVHIAYYDFGNGDLKYAKRSSTWTISTLDSTGDVGQFCSLDIGLLGLPQIAYLDWTNHRLKMADKKLFGGWGIFVVDSSAWVGYHASLAIDKEGRTHIAYQDFSNQNLKYAQSSVNGWQFSVVDSTGDAGSYATLALDSNNNPHISYYDASLNLIKYANKIATASFSLASINPNANASNTALVSSFSYTSISLDPSGKAVVVFTDTVLDNLNLARLSQKPSLSWTAEAGYASDGLEPHEGNNFTPFNFRVKYSDPDGDGPQSGYPRVRVKKGDKEIGGSPFTLNYQFGTALQGAVYGVSVELPEGQDFSYSFEAKDAWGTAANPTASQPGPKVANAQTTGISESETYSYPNPVGNQPVTLRFAVNFPDPQMEIKIFDVSGELLKTITHEEIAKNQAPVYNVVWDLKDKTGNDLASGIYVWALQAKDRATGQEQKSIKKLAVLK